MLRIKRLFIVSLSFALLFGCYGSEEIDDLGFVMAVGIDEREEDNKLLVTVQIVRPADASGLTGGGGGETGEPIWTAVGEGDTIFEAVRDLGQYSSRRVFWAHTAVVVIGDSVARNRGIVDIIDFFSRNNQLRMRTWVVVTEDTASHIVGKKTGLEVIPGLSVDKLFRYTDILAEAPKTDMRSISAAYLKETEHPIITRIIVNDRQMSGGGQEEFGQEKQVSLSGTAVFRDDKLVGYLDRNETRGMLWFTDPFDSAIIPLSCGDDEKNETSVELRRNQLHLEPFYKDGEISFHATITTKGEIVEIGCPSKEAMGEVYDRLEKELEETIKNEIESMLQKVQEEFKVDIIRLGRTFKTRYPKVWKTKKDEWDELFQSVNVEVSVDAQINRQGLLTKPTRTQN